MSRATVFWHFSDKESLFRECFNRLCEPFRISLARDQSGLPAEKRLREQVALYQSFIEQHRTDVDGFIRWAMEHPQFRDWLTRTLLDLHNPLRRGVDGDDRRDRAAASRSPRDRHGHPVMLDGGVFLSYFDDSQRMAERRRASVDAILELIPRRVAGRF